MKEARQIQPFRLQTSSSSISYGCSVINNFFADSVIMILFLHITALYFQNGFILKKFNYRSNVKNLGVLNLVLVFFAIICRLLPRSTTTTDGGHVHIQRDNSFSIAQHAAVEKDDDGEEAAEVLVKSTEETDGEEEEDEVAEMKNELLLRSVHQEAVDEDGVEVEGVLEKSKEELEDDEDCEVVLGKSKEEPEEEVVEKKKKDLEENDENGPRPHRSRTKGEHHDHHYHRLCHRYHQIPMNQQQLSVGNERSNNNTFPDPRKESFPAPEERIFHYNLVNRYQYAPLHRPHPSAPPVPESYYTQYTSNPRTTWRVDASTSPPQQTLQSEKNPLPLPPPRRRKEREERRISSQSKKAKKGESGRFRFQSIIPPATTPVLPPQPEIAPSVQPPQSSAAQSSSLPPAPPPPAKPQSFLKKLFKPNNDKKKVNIADSLPPLLSLAHPPPPPASPVLYPICKKSSKITEILPNAGLPPPLPPQPPSPPPPPAPPPLEPCNLRKNTRPSSPMPQNLMAPAPKATKSCGMKRTTNQGTPPPPMMTNTLPRKREQNTDSYPKKVIYVETGNQSPLDGIAQPPPPLPFPNRGMKFVAHGDLVNIQSSSSDSVDDPPSTPCYKAKNMNDPSSSSTTNPSYVNYETSSYPPHSPPEFYTIMHPIFPPSRISV